MARKFIYDNGEEKLGPVTGAELLRLRAEGEIDDNTWVRREDSATWRPLRNTDLREEREKEASRSLWSLLFRHLSPGLKVAIFLFLLIIVVMLLTVAAYLWPVLLCLLLVWMLYRIISR